MMFLTSGTGIIEYLYAKKLLRPIPYTTKISSAWVIDLNVKHEKTKLKKTEEYICDLWLGKYFFDTAPNI